MSQPSSVDPVSSAPDRAWSPSDLAGDPHAAADKAARVQRMFGAIARRYDLNNRLHSFGLDRCWRARAVREAGVTSESDVLDVACGTGDLSLAFIRAGARQVIGADFTPQMLDLARDKARRRGALGERLRFEHGDAMNLEYSDASFDIVSIAFGLRNVSDPPRALTEFRRVLRPGGRLVVLEFSRPRNRLVRAGNDFYTRRVMPLTATLIARDRSGAYRYLPRSVETFPEGNDLLDLIRRAGFTSTRAVPLTMGVCTISIGQR